MIQSKYKNPVPEFVDHGVKESGGYTYVLKIDLIGQTIIQRVKSDNTEILFAAKSSATTIASFWSDPTIHNYTYFHALSI